MNFFSPPFFNKIDIFKSIIFMVLVNGLFQNTISGNACDTEEQLPKNRLYVAVDEKLNPAQQVQRIHAVVKDLGKKVPSEQLSFLPYIDASGITYEDISAFPFIVIKGNQPKLKEFANFSNSGCAVVSRNNSQNSGTIEAVAAFGLGEILQPATKRFQVYRPKMALFSPFVENDIDSSDDVEAAFCFLSETLEPGNMLNSLSHMTIGTGGTHYDQFYTGTTTEDILHHLWENCRQQKLTHVTFSDTMHLGPTYKEQIAATRKKTIGTLRVTGLYVHGKLGVLRFLRAIIK